MLCYVDHTLRNHLLKDSRHFETSNKAHNRIHKPTPGNKGQPQSTPQLDQPVDPQETHDLGGDPYKTHVQPYGKTLLQGCPE